MRNWTSPSDTNLMITVIKIAPWKMSEWWGTQHPPFSNQKQMGTAHFCLYICSAHSRSGRAWEQVGMRLRKMSFNAWETFTRGQFSLAEPTRSQGTHSLPLPGPQSMTNCNDVCL
jgi:hypothetical protein